MTEKDKIINVAFQKYRFWNKLNHAFTEKMLDRKLWVLITKDKELYSETNLDAIDGIVHDIAYLLFQQERMLDRRINQLDDGSDLYTTIRMNQT